MSLEPSCPKCLGVFDVVSVPLTEVVDAARAYVAQVDAAFLEQMAAGGGLKAAGPFEAYTYRSARHIVSMFDRRRADLTPNVLVDVHSAAAWGLR